MAYSKRCGLVFVRRVFSRRRALTLLLVRQRAKSPFVLSTLLRLYQAGEPWTWTHLRFSFRAVFLQISTYSWIPVPGFPCLKLIGPLYGLVQAPLAFDRLVKGVYTQKCHVRQLQSDRCVFIRVENDLKSGSSITANDILDNGFLQQFNSEFVPLSIVFILLVYIHLQY